MLRVAVCVPTSGMVAASFAYSLAGLVAKSKELAEVGLLMQEGSVVHANRELLVENALKWGATHVMFVDDDMSFHESALAQLLAWDKSFVACNYPKRMLPIGFTAVGLDGLHVVTRANSEGLEEVAYAGFGVSLIEVKVFEKTPRPWFIPQYVADAKMYRTEDASFCERVKNAGFHIFVDHAVSRTVAHRGAHAYSWESWRPKQSMIGVEIASLSGPQ